MCDVTTMYHLPYMWGGTAGVCNCLSCAGYLVVPVMCICGYLVGTVHLWWEPYPRYSVPKFTPVCHIGAAASECVWGTLFWDLPPSWVASFSDQSDISSYTCLLVVYSHFSQLLKNLVIMLPWCDRIWNLKYAFGLNFCVQHQWIPFGWVYDTNPFRKGSTLTASGKMEEEANCIP